MVEQGQEAKDFDSQADEFLNKVGMETPADSCFLCPRETSTSGRPS